MIINMYITMLPVIMGGIMNMIFTKTPIYKKLKKPIDGGWNFKDGRRIFGENKTWAGFFSMMIFCCITQIAEGMILDIFNMTYRNEFYLRHENTLFYNMIIGILLGAAYMIMELPNSFIKRRINIPSGKTAKGITGKIFFIIDQVDSLIGVMLILYMVSEISFAKYLLYIFLGGITHITVNAVLYGLKIRKNL